LIVSLFASLPTIFGDRLSTIFADLCLNKILECRNQVLYIVGLCQDLLIPVTNFHNEDKGFMVLPGDVFDLPIRKDIIHRVVRWQLAKRQQVVTYLFLSQDGDIFSILTFNNFGM